MSTFAPQTHPIALTMGDPAGIGPEIIAKLYVAHPATMQNCLVVGDVAHMRRACALITTAWGQTSLPIVPIEHASHAQNLPPRCMAVMQVDKRQTRSDLRSLGNRKDPNVNYCANTLLEFGRIDPRAGALAAESVIWAAQAALRGEVAAIVTAPLHKEALHAAGYDFPGHTELLQSLAAAHLGVNLDKLPVRMMLANNELRTVLLSIHMSLRQALQAVTLVNLTETLEITHRALHKMLGRPPRIAVAGLNPHAGEGGKFGSEELDIIAPAIRQAQARGWAVSGPFAPDTIFMRARAQYIQSAPIENENEKPNEAIETTAALAQKKDTFDAVIAMYHDQGLIPVKYLGIEDGVNVTLGLPLVRTSPDHGTAFDIAGSTKANAASMLAALNMARSLCRD